MSMFKATRFEYLKCINKRSEMDPQKLGSINSESTDLKGLELLERLYVFEKGIGKLVISFISIVTKGSQKLADKGESIDLLTVRSGRA